MPMVSLLNCWWRIPPQVLISLLIESNNICIFANLVRYTFSLDIQLAQFFNILKLRCNIKDVGNIVFSFYFGYSRDIHSSIW